MQLPPHLKQAFEAEAMRSGLAKLSNALAELSDNYRFRQGSDERFISTEAQRIAYIATRMPATYAAVHAVLTEVGTRMPELQVTSLLDLGAGPGTAAWAASQAFAELQQITLIEWDKELRRLGKTFTAQAPNEALRTGEWMELDLSRATAFTQHDIVIASYTLGELPQGKAREILFKAWPAAAKVLVIVEPGTTKGFALLRQLREDVIGLGGNIIAPCPHQATCPMSSGDWCHFAARVERSALHRKLKAGALSFEDEKYAYLAIAKQPVKSAFARIIRRPQINSGYVKLSLCTTYGLQNSTITRRDKESFKKARKADWGDSWE